MTVKLLTEQHLEFLSLKGGCTVLSGFIHVEMSHCWKSHAVALFCTFAVRALLLFLLNALDLRVACRVGTSML